MIYEVKIKTYKQITTYRTIETRPDTVEDVESFIEEIETYYVYDLSKFLIGVEDRGHEVVGIKLLDEFVKVD